MTASAGLLAPVAAAASTALALGAIHHRVVASRPAVGPVAARRAELPVATIRRTAAVLTIAAAAVTLGPVAAAVLAATGVGVARLRPLLVERRRWRAVERDLPDAVDLLVLGIHAGLTPRQSVELLARSAPTSIRPSCGHVVHEMQRGAAFADALAVLGERLGSDARSIADVLANADRYGFPLAPVLDQLGAEARAARRRFAEADARRLPVRLSFPLVACTLPSFVLLAIAPAVVAALSSLGGTSW